MDIVLRVAKCVLIFDLILDICKLSRWFGGQYTQMDN